MPKKKYVVSFKKDTSAQTAIYFPLCYPSHSYGVALHINVKQYEVSYYTFYCFCIQTVHLNHLSTASLTSSFFLVLK